MRSGHQDEDRAALLRLRHETRDFALERMFHLMLWGALFTGLFALDSLLTYGVFTLSAVLREGIFVSLMIGVTFASCLFERFHAMNPVNILSRSLLVLWMGIGAALLIVDFLGGITGIAGPGPRAGAMASLIALGFTVSAAVTGQRGPQILAVFWWGLAVIFFFLGPDAADLLAAAAFFGGLFLPGLCLFGLYWHNRRTMRDKKKRPA